MPPESQGASNHALAFIELGIAVLALSFLSRLASRWRFSAIPLYLLAGLAFGAGGVAPIRFSGEFVRFGSEIGVILLLFMLGLEYTGKELAHALRGGFKGASLDILLNFTPGVIAGFMLGLKPVACFLLGGVTYISSSGVVAKVLGDLGRLKNPETPAVISILVLEDLAMALYLPVASVMLAGEGFVDAAVSVAVALAAVFAILFVAIRFGRTIGRIVTTRSDESLLLTVIGLVLLVAGLAQQLQVSAAVGAFLVGVALTGTVSRRTQRLMEPLRDLFAATFFLFFGLQIDPSTLPPVLVPALLLALVATLTKLATGWIVATDMNCSRNGRLRAGAALVARGEFSIVIAGLGSMSGSTDKLGPLAAAFVLITAVVGPILVKLTPPSTTVESQDESIPESTV